MKKIKSISIVVCMLAVLSVVNIAHAELFNRGTDILGNRLIYDSDLNITWYDYSNVKSSWQNQMAWAGALSVTFGGSTYDDWRLPSTWPECIGYNCDSSQMGHLYFTELGNGSIFQFTGDFQNLEAYYYWSSNSSGITAYYFNFGNHRGDSGYQGVAFNDGTYYALSVRTGDVAVVPEPFSAILFISGGTLLAGRRYLKRKRIA